MHKRIKIGISTYKDVDHLTMLLQSIDWYTQIPKDQYDIVVCDDGSPNVFRCNNCGEEIPTRGSVPSICPRCGTSNFTFKSWTDEIKAVCDRFGAVFIQNVDRDGHPCNQGIPSTWNHLASSLNGDAEIVVLLNNDILVVPNWLQTAVHFLDANKDNPHVGSMFWNPFNRFHKEMMAAILPNLGHTLYSSLDQVTGSNDWFALAHEKNPKVVESRQGDGQGLGRVACPCGCCFAFRMDVFREVEQYRREFYAKTYGVDPNTICGAFDPRFTSFFEESVEEDRYMVVKDSAGDIHVSTIGALFDKYAQTLKVDGNSEYVYPVELYALSGEVDTSSESVEKHYLTPKEKAAYNGDLTQSSSKQAAQLSLTRAKEKVKSGLHVNVGVWDRIDHIVRHKSDKNMVRVWNKFGETVCTEDHSLIVYDNGRLSEARPCDMNGRPLERVWELPEIEEIESIDLASIVDSVDGIRFDDEWIWYTYPNGGAPTVNPRIRRHIDVGTPEMDALCTILGWHIAEGCTHLHARTKNGGTSASAILVCGQKIAISEQAKQLFSLLSDAPVKVHKHNKRRYAPVYSAVCAYRVAYHLFSEMVGVKSYNKRIPNFVFRLPKQHQIQVWDSMMEGDGFVHKELGTHCCTEAYKSKYFLYTTNSRGMIADLSVLLTGFGEHITTGRRIHPDGKISYWIRNSTSFIGWKGHEAKTEPVPRKGEYVYDLGTHNTHRFTDAHGLILVHNSHFGFCCASLGKAAFGFPYPRPYHAHGYTFGVNQELEASRRMVESRKLFRDYWGVPYNDPSDFDWIHTETMSKIPKTTLKYLSPDYESAPDVYVQPGGQKMIVPKLVEREAEF